VLVWLQVSRRCKEFYLLGLIKIIFLYLTNQNHFIMEQNQSSLFNLSIDSNTASTIKTSTQWARILAICGIIMGALVVVIGLIIPSIMRNSMRSSGFSNYDRESMDSAMAAGMGVGMVLYIIMGALIILGNIFLLNYANKTSAALNANDSSLLNAGMAGLRNYFTFWGIIMILSMLLMIIGILGVVAAG
jgi:Family of unknown function (DUF5362)